MKPYSAPPTRMLFRAVPVVFQSPRCLLPRAWLSQDDDSACASWDTKEAALWSRGHTRQSQQGGSRGGSEWPSSVAVLWPLSLELSSLMDSTFSSPNPQVLHLPSIFILYQTLPTCWSLPFLADEHSGLEVLLVEVALKPAHGVLESQRPHASSQEALCP